jgi:hypothetical protein
MKYFTVMTMAGAVSATTSIRASVIKSVVSNSSSTVPPHYPYASIEHFFTNSGTEKGDMDLAELRCAASGANEKVHDITDGKQDRCFVTVTPSSDQDGPYPVLFFAHGSGGNAANCGGRPDETGKSWVQVAKENSFVLVCGEALQYSATNSENPGAPPLQGGLWEIPEVFTNATGQNCDDKDSFDNVYIDNVIAELNKQPDIYDTSRFFVHGCSMGSAFTVWQGPCLHSKAPSNVTAFATHSTGLKIKGDGLRFPPDTYNSQYEWGECPTCEYWPTVVEKVDGLKACIFDNTADPSDQHPDFYTSSQQLATHWANAGNRAAETHYGSGGHCVQHSFEAIATCLDDGTGRLIPGGSKPSPAPSHSPSPGTCTDVAPDTNYTCAEQKNFGKCDKPWMEGFCCKTCFDCKSGCGK